MESNSVIVVYDFYSEVWPTIFRLTEDHNVNALNIKVMDFILNVCSSM